MADQLNQAVLQNLKNAEDKDANEKQLKAEELQPVRTVITDMASDKLRDVADYAIKKVNKAGVALIKNRTGIDLDRSKELLENKAEQMYNTARNRLPELQQQAQSTLSNKINEGRNAISNALNSLRSEVHNPAPHLEQTIVRSAENELEHVKL